jgi:hypothetical protein
LTFNNIFFTGEVHITRIILGYKNKHIVRNSFYEKQWRFKTYEWRLLI